MTEYNPTKPTQAEYPDVTQEALEFLVIGAGQAGQRLYGKAIACNQTAFPNAHVTLFDNDPKSLDLNRFPNVSEQLNEAKATGRLDLTSQLNDKMHRPDVVIVATSPGHHIEGYVEALKVFGVPTATGFEKVMLDAREKPTFATLGKLGLINVAKLRVNETRALSSGVRRGRQIVDSLLASGAKLTDIESVQYKLRIARFFDTYYSAQGIEGTHGFSAAAGLTGISLADSRIVKNLHLNQNSKDAKEATYVVLESELNGNSVISRFAQGLGNFSIDAHGSIKYVADDLDGKPGNPGVRRTIQASFDTGDYVKILFDPHGKPNSPPLSTVVEYKIAGVVNEEIIADDTIAYFAHGLAQLALGEADILPYGTTPEYASEHSKFLRSIYLQSEKIRDQRQKITQL